MTVTKLPQNNQRWFTASTTLQGFTVGITDKWQSLVCNRWHKGYTVVKVHICLRHALLLVIHIAISGDCVSAYVLIPHN